jgi:double-stranded uracil-DNA glycosylase
MLIPDLLQHGLRLVFCGTALSAVSYRKRAYYANPGNLFWPTLHRTGITPTRFTPNNYPKLLELGIGLTDLCKTEYGNDSELSKHALDADALHQKILTYQPHILAFTSKNAAQTYLKHNVEYGLQKEMVGNTRLYVLCSSSGLARGYWREDIWQNLATLYKEGG